MEKYVSNIKIDDVIISEEDLNWLYNDTEEELIMSKLTENIGFNKLKDIFCNITGTSAHILYVIYSMITNQIISNRNIINENISSIQKKKIKKLIEKYELEKISNENNNIDNKSKKLKQELMKSCLQHYNLKPFDVNIDPNMNLKKIKDQQKLEMIKNKIKNRNDVYNLYSKTIEDFGYKFKSNEFKEILYSIK